MSEAVSIPAVQPLQPVAAEGVFFDRIATQTPDSRSAQTNESAPKPDAKAPEVPSPLTNTHLAFSIDHDTGHVLLRIVDDKTNEVVRQIPPEEFVRIATRMAKMIGLLFDHKS